MSDAKMNETPIRLIVGLGNPGDEYAETRHNIGFMMIDALLDKFPKSFEREHRSQSNCWSGSYAGKALTLQKPLTFMNLSGDAVAPLAAALGIRPEEILVIHDDMDLPLGKLRIRKNGSCGGHNGIRSIIDRLGSENFPRIRIGIGHAKRRGDTVNHVLSGFSGEEKVILDQVLAGAADAVVLMLRRGISMAMNTFNAKNYAPEEESSGIETTTDSDNNNVVS